MRLAVEVCSLLMRAALALNERSTSLGKGGLGGFARMGSMYCEGMAEVLESLPAAATAASDMDTAVSYEFFRELAFGVHGAVPSRAAQLLSAYASHIMMIDGPLPLALSGVAATRHQVVMDLMLRASAPPEVVEPGAVGQPQT